MRMLYDNAADRATITLPSTAPGLGAAYLQTDVRSEVCRVQSGSATITAAWAAAETIDTVVLPAVPLSAAATVRARLYDTANVVLADTGVLQAHPGGRTARPVDVALYLPASVSARRLVINLVDAGRTWLDLPRLIAGVAHHLHYAPGYGAGPVIEDTGSHQRSAAGDLRTELGTLSRTLPFDLEWVHEDDHGLVLDILECGIGRSMWIDLVDEPGFSPSERAAMRIYGRQDKGGALPMIAPRLHQTRFSFLGW
ncbi:hypothetical protein FOZ76_11670 [Verticiella sediminum]|uniref:Uncharacterized protein n=1 Tax=Verticiella sediminum TaxID=1247510 RepID=A0A556API0_9BURK|nr:hypothetical protein [Verticiella sediminum]TSH94795.1 hypothetical protein FOZ76_11670 [Verticiella sediminum]